MNSSRDVEGAGPFERSIGNQKDELKGSDDKALKNRQEINFKSRRRSRRGRTM